ncbi:phosphatidate cytidylyltransferase [Leeia oryzae]|uniref:phosphatidate cytidylyltransferase n=1 Tax=Leeia oryzae TaxID=356662 RepID=UPI00037A035B|nr:phosphatidate cytidylyltransferase [Leeia oryzae]
MLKTRLLTALFLIPLVFLALFKASPYAWQGIMAGVVLLAAWEWSRLAKFSPLIKVLFIGLTAVAGVGVYIGWHMAAFRAIWIVFTLGFWFVLVPLWLWKKAKIDQPVVMWLAGWLVLLPFWLGMEIWRNHAPSIPSGARLLLAIMMLVWVADTAAYFAGKAFGKHKLAPAISPGKTWEGAVGAAVGVLIYAYAMSFTHWLLPLGLSLPALLLLGVVMTPLSIIGDLYESWLKRCAGVKDSSQLLPGHGGILDRIDALMAVVSVSLVLFELSRSI